MKTSYGPRSIFYFLLCFTSCNSPNHGEGSGEPALCENKLALLNFYDNADTVHWDLTLSRIEFLESLLEQSGSDSCDGPRYYYLNVEHDSLEQIYFPAFAGKLGCKCCPTPPPARLHEVKVYLLKDSVIIDGYLLPKNEMGDSMPEIIERKFIVQKKGAAFFDLSWNEDVKLKDKEAALVTLLDSYFLAIEKKFTHGKGLCRADSIVEGVPKLVLLAVDYGAPPKPPVLQDSSR